MMTRRITVLRKKDIERWVKRHPPRVPTAQEAERVKDGAKFVGSSIKYCGTEEIGNRDVCGGWHLVTGGLVQDDPQPDAGWPSYDPDKGEFVVYQHDKPVLKYPTDVKVAECVVEPEVK